MSKMYYVTEKGILSDLVFSPDNLNADSSVYEVIRVKDGIALFLEDHYSRLKNSISTQNMDSVFSFSEFKNKIVELISINKITEGNIRFVLSANKSEINWAFAFIPHSYPSQEEYRLGVPTGLLFAERENPNAKIIQSNLRDKANQMIKEKLLYEVLLVDRDGMITEGSRSNVFFVKNGVFYTEAAAKILPGITRAKVMECIQSLSYKVIEQSVSVNEIIEFDAVFLTGTSPKVLPVRSIEKTIFGTDNEFVLELIDRYDLMIADYLKNEKSV